MQWQEFYSTWLALIGRIDREVLGVWNEYISACDRDTALEAVNSLAEKYNPAKEKDSFVLMPNLWQFRREYENIRERKRQQKKSCVSCGFCENSGTVYVLDTGNYQSDEFPVDPGVYDGRRCLCVVPCPHCRKDNYSGMAELSDRIIRFCRPFSRRDELLMPG
ncbi:MAG: hypothetical protein E7057_05035 [Lentisphaerae bacterium]|nr:hypothetical protein [Lentisphaerota bacterium]